MNFQSTSIGRSSMTFTTHREVSHAHGHTGSQKNSRSAIPPVYPRDRSDQAPAHPDPHEADEEQGPETDDEGDRRGTRPGHDGLDVVAEAAAGVVPGFAQAT